jgi:hypothetical protein
MDLLDARRRYDVDKDGYLNKEEYKRYLMGIGCFWHNDSSCCDPESWHKAFVRYTLAVRWLQLSSPSCQYSTVCTGCLARIGQLTTDVM